MGPHFTDDEITFRQRLLECWTFTRAGGPRTWGGALVRGQRVPFVGRICMDMCMLDITDVPAKEGDEVIVFGPDLPVSEMARQLETIPYEVLTNVSRRVKRVYFQE